MGGAVAVAGCAGVGSQPAVVIELTAVTNEAIARRDAPSIDDFERPQQRAIRAVLDGRDVKRFGTSTLIENGTVVRANGHAYEITYRAIGRIRSASTFRIALERGATGNEFVRANTVSFDALPRVDRVRLRRGGYGRDASGYGVLDSQVYSTREREESMLVPTPDFDRLRWPDGTTATVSVTSESGMTLTLFDYRGRVTWQSLSAFGASLVDRVAIVIESPSAPERAVLDRAIEDGYRRNTLPADDPGLESLVDRFEAATPIADGSDGDEGSAGEGNGDEGDRDEWNGNEGGGDGNGGEVDGGGGNGEEMDVDGTYLVRYDGETYWGTVTYHGD